MESTQLIGMESYIDPAILDIILAINQLPFVDRTMWCCAGYGDHAPLTLVHLPDNTLHLVLNRTRKHCLPYVTIKYRGTTDFHRELQDLVYRTSAHQYERQACHYTLLAPRKGGRVENEMEAKWAQVRELVARYKNGG